MLNDNIYIIIADDNKRFIEGLMVLLSKFDHCITIAAYQNGKDLLESPFLANADLILCDIEMPVMNGIEAAKRINFHYPNLPMIALTMHIEKVFLDDIIMAGFKGFIYKPEVSDRLNETITQVMKNNFMFPLNIKLK